MQNSKNTTLLLTILTALVAGVCIGLLIPNNGVRKSEGFVSQDIRASNKLDAIWGIVERHYVDNLSADTVMDKVYAAILSALDPHSRYLSAKELARESETLQGYFDGVGIVLRVVDDTICVDQVIPGGPSDKAGIIAGDRLLSVDSSKLSGVKLPVDKAVQLLRGPRGSQASILVKRPTEPSARIIKVSRNVIKTPSLAYNGMLDKQTGYIRLTQFSESTYEEFCAAVRNLRKKGMKRMILDLRDNNGGLLSAALNICDELLSGDELIVYTEGAHSRRKEVHSHRGGLFAEGELIVLIDEFSASASEIVAGAIQDNDRGLVVGRRSFGKGLVQQQFDLRDNSAIMLTIARYYTPSGRCIQRPYDKGTDEYYSDFIQQLTQNIEKDSVLMQITDSTQYRTVKGRIVYGGGGIYPDHVINYKKYPDIAYYNALINKNIFSTYTFNFISYNGAVIKQEYPTEDNFVNNYKVSDQMIEAIVRLGEKQGLSRNTKSISRYKEEMRSLTKALIGNMLYSSATYYRVHIWTDPEIKEAISLFK
ncbi:MAG: S41 family peptidase [Bacteroidales bacterium]|nr:S41 family peptidase [Bacteroidales bacterium]